MRRVHQVLSQLRCANARKAPLFAVALAAGWLALAPQQAFGQEDTELAEGKVEAELDAATDTDVAERLTATFASLDALENVAVDVEAGIVRLTGLVDSSSARELAGDLAQQIEGVTAIENDIEENRSVSHRLNLAVTRLVDRAWTLVDSLPLLLISIAVLALALVLSRLSVAWELPFRWLTDNVFLRDLAKQAVRLAVLIGGALIALEILDATALVGAVLGAAGVAGLAIGFAFRDLVKNYIASILLSLRRPFSPRDLVEIDGKLGRVARLTSRATILVTPSGNHVRIPNAIVFKATIQNFTRRPQRRFDFGVAVGVEEDLVAASELGTSILESMRGVIDAPEPFCRIDELGDSSVTLTFYGWVDQRETDFGKVRSEAIRLVKQAFDRQEIEMPEPIHRIRIESMPERAPEPKAVPSAASEEVGDIERESHVDDMINEERRSGEDDLLEAAGREE